jgi:hypothetical protein
MTAFSNLVPTERHGLRSRSTAAAITATTNTQIILFVGAPVATQGTPYIIGATNVAPLAGTGNWINVVNDAAFGSTFKFNKRGVYFCQSYAQNQVAGVTAVQIGITLDCAAASLLVATPLTPATVGLIDLNDFTSIADAGIPARASGLVYITDTLAGGAQPTAVAGATGVGVLRFHASTGAGAVVGEASLIEATVRAEITRMNDMAG